MTYHRSLGQAAPDMTFSITDPDVAASQGLTTPTSTTPAPAPSSGGKTSSTSLIPSYSSGGGKTSGSSTPITSAAYMPDASAGGTPSWLPWAIGGGVAVIGLGLIFAARS